MGVLTTPETDVWLAFERIYADEWLLGDGAMAMAM